METRLLDRKAIVPPPPSPFRMLLAAVSVLWVRLACALRRRADALLRWAQQGRERFVSRPVRGLQAARDLHRPRVSGWKRISTEAPTRISGVRRIA